MRHIPATLSKTQLHLRVTSLAPLDNRTFCRGIQHCGTCLYLNNSLSAKTTERVCVRDPKPVCKAIEPVSFICNEHWNRCCRGAKNVCFYAYGNMYIAYHKNYLCSLGNEEFNAKNFDKAIKYYSEAIRLDPENHIYYSNRRWAMDYIFNCNALVLCF